jgi:hypothetical protein
LSTTARDVDAGEIRGMLLEIAGPEGEEDVMTAGEQLIEQGVQRGRIDNLRENIAAVLAARSIALSEVGRARLASCADADTLTAWLLRAATASSEADVFAPASAP